MIEVLFCDECESFFETTEDMAATIRYMQSDYECYGDVTVRCNACELKAMVAEQETDFEADMLCYNCGNTLTVGEDAPGDLCYHCIADEYQLEQEGMENETENF